MAQPQEKTYTQGHSSCTLATHQRRTAQSEAAFLLPHIRPTARVLDVGCGPGTVTIGLAEHAPEGATLGVDISAAVIEKAQANAAASGCSVDGPGAVRFEVGDVMNLAYADESFDVVFAAHVFGHFAGPEQPVRALMEIRRVLKPNGILATRELASSHFYPRRLDLDRLWAGNLSRSITHGRAASGTNVDITGARMPEFFHKAGFDASAGKLQVGVSAVARATAEERKFLAWRAKGQLTEGDPFRQSWIEAGISVAEIHETLRAIEAWAETDDAWMTMLHGEMLGWK